MSELYSFSRIQTFFSCPYRYKLQYIDKAEPDFPNTIEAFMGSCVHAALEKLYKDLHFKKLNTVQDLIDFYDKTWDKTWDDAILIPRKDYSAQQYKQIGTDCIKDYYQRFKPFDHDKTIGTEEYIEFPLDDAKEYMFRGYIDRLSYDGKGLYSIHDYKTSNSLKSQQDADDDAQLALYAFGVRRNYQDCKRVRLIWHMLRHNKDVTIEKTDKDLEQVRLDAISNIKKIRSAQSFPTKQSALCSWCGYQPQCPHFRHLFMLERMLENKHVGEDGQTLAARYAALKQKELKVQEQIKEVSDAIYNYAEKHGIQSLFGPGVQLKIWQKECTALPRSNDPRLDQFKEILRKRGIFEKVATVDSWKLGRMIDDGDLDLEDLKVLDPYISKESRKRIYLSKQDRY